MGMNTNNKLIELPSYKPVMQYHKAAKVLVEVGVSKELKTFGLWNENMMNEPMEAKWKLERKPIVVKPIEDIFKHYVPEVNKDIYTQGDLFT